MIDAIPSIVVQLARCFSASSESIDHACAVPFLLAVRASAAPSKKTSCSSIHSPTSDIARCRFRSSSSSRRRRRKKRLRGKKAVFRWPVRDWYVTSSSSSSMPRFSSSSAHARARLYAKKSQSDCTSRWGSRS